MQAVTLPPPPPVNPPAGDRPVPLPSTAQPAPRPPVSPPAVSKAPSKPTLAGRWVYSPASKSGSPFPPEAVTLLLTQAASQVSGSLAGRYKVPKGQNMNPRVIFTFTGPLRAGSSKFTFSGADGLRGEIELIQLPGKQDAIEVVWYSERDKLTFDDVFFRVP